MATIVELKNLDCIDNMRGGLLPEVEKWCRKNLRGKYQFEFAEMGRGQHTIWFERDTDAVHFKMRWIG